MPWLTLTKGYRAHVDAIDYPWCAAVRGPLVYAKRVSKGKTLYLHRVIAGTLPGQFTDHKNGDTLDNRRENLRTCTNLENRRAFRHKRLGSSKYRGVSWCTKYGFWEARIGVNGASLFLGYFGQEVEAALAYDRAALQRFEQFAHLNFPV